MLAAPPGVGVDGHGASIADHDIHVFGSLPEHVGHEAQMDADEDDQEMRERSTGSSSSNTQRRKRSSESITTVNATDRVSRRTKRAPVPLPVPPIPKPRSRSTPSNTKKPIPPRGRASSRRTRAHAEGGDSALIDEVEITRCVCGLNGEDNWEGFMLQCEQCNVWQHGDCVSIPDEAVAPKHYYCEQCRPELHAKPLEATKEDDMDVEDQLKPSKQRESADAAIVSSFLSKTAPRPIEEEPSSTPAGAPMYPPTSHFAEPKNPGKRRSTMNSRDAAYEESLAQALALSRQENGMLRQTSDSRKSRSTTQEADETGPPPPTRRRPPSVSRKRPRRGARVTEEPEIEPEPEIEVQPEPVTLPQDVNGREESPVPSESPVETDLQVGRPARNGNRRNERQLPDVRAPSPAESSEGRSGSNPPSTSSANRHSNQPAPRIRHVNGDKAVRLSPAKRKQLQIAKETDGDDSSVPLASLAPARKRKFKGGAAHASAAAAAVVAVANAVALDEADEAVARHSTNPWHLPAHLEHLTSSLGEPPEAPIIPKPRYPTKRATISDMRKRANGLLRYLERSTDLLESAPGSSSPEGLGTGGGSARDLIAELQRDVRAFQSRFAHVPSAPARSLLSTSIVAEG